MSLLSCSFDVSYLRIAMLYVATNVQNETIRICTVYCIDKKETNEVMTNEVRYLSHEIRNKNQAV